MKSFLYACLLLAATTARAGTYEVPMVADVGGLNVFAMDGMSIADVDGVLHLRYDLPIEITGPERRTLDMPLVERHLGFLRFKQETPKAEATCMRAARHIRCFTGYEPTIADPLAAAAFVRERYGNDSSLAKRLMVTASFGHEAIGVLAFEDPGL